MPKRRIHFIVTNELSYDQRMIRICTSLANNGYQVCLVGRQKKGAPALKPQPFQQKRLSCWFEKGMFLYAEFNIRVFFYLLFRRTDIMGAIDLDTILPVWIASFIRRKERLYDAHELFCEMQEISSRPGIYKVWKFIERLTVPRFPKGYTVNTPIAEEFQRMYGVNYAVVRNLPFLEKELNAAPAKDPYLIYQGAVNEGRSFETLIPAMKNVSLPLWICGDGNFMAKARELVRVHGLEDKILFKGMIPPDELPLITRQAYAGITLFSPEGKSNYYSLANRFFDYVQAGIPQICVNYPVYKELNNLALVSVLTDDLDPDTLAHKLNTLICDKGLYNALKQNCLIARLSWNWQEEEKTLLDYYKRNFQ